MSPKPARLSAPDPEFWQLDLDEQITRAKAYTCHKITQPLMEILVRELADTNPPPDPNWDVCLANLIHSARAFGRAEALAIAEAERAEMEWRSLRGHRSIDDDDDDTVAPEGPHFRPTATRMTRRRIPIADRLRTATGDLR